MKKSLKKTVELIDKEFINYELMLTASTSILLIKNSNWELKGFLRALNEYGVLSDSDYRDYRYKAMSLKYKRMEELE